MGVPGLNQYLARINVSCSRTQHSDAGEVRTRTHSSQALYHRANVLLTSFVNINTLRHFLDTNAYTISIKVYTGNRVYNFVNKDVVFKLRVNVNTVIQVCSRMSGHFLNKMLQVVVFVPLFYSNQASRQECVIETYMYYFSTQTYDMGTQKDRFNDGYM